LLKFDSKADEGIFLGYATNSHAYRVYNKRLMIVEESVHVVFDESNSKLQDQVVIDVDEDDIILEKQARIGNVNMLHLYHKLNLKMWMMHRMIVIGSLPCKMNLINSLEMMYCL